MSSPEILVDARGHRCPVPTLRLRRALEQAPAGARVRLLADDPLARIDVPHLVASLGLVLVEQAQDGEALSFLVAASGADSSV
jgi:tRNA 2-thiouridine synthesizing protein A